MIYDESTVIVEADLLRRNAATILSLVEKNRAELEQMRAQLAAATVEIGRLQTVVAQTQTGINMIRAGVV